MGDTCIDAEVVVSNYNTVEVSTDGRPVVTGVVSASVETPYKQYILEVDVPTRTVEHELLKRPIGAMITVDGSPIRWEKSGITRTEDGDGNLTGEMVFPFDVNDEIIFFYK